MTNACLPGRDAHLHLDRARLDADEREVEIWPYMRPLAAHGPP